MGLPSVCTETLCKNGASCIVEAVLPGSPVGNGACIRTWLIGSPSRQRNGVVALSQKGFCPRARCTRCRCSNEVCHHAAQDVPKAPSASRQGGFCICQEPGATRAKWRVEFLSALSKACPQSSSCRLLKAGHLLIDFLAVEVENVPADLEYSGGFVAAACFTQFVHVSLMYLTPFRPTFQVMEVEEETATSRYSPMPLRFGSRCGGAHVWQTLPLLEAFGNTKYTADGLC